MIIDWSIFDLELKSSPLIEQAVALSDALKNARDGWRGEETAPAFEDGKCVQVQPVLQRVMCHLLSCTREGCFSLCLIMLPCVLSLLPWPANRFPFTIIKDLSIAYLKRTLRRRGKRRARKHRCILRGIYFFFFTPLSNVFIHRSADLTGEKRVRLLQQIKTTCGTVMTALTVAVHLFVKWKLLNR